jgi:hypothetical protein
VTADYLFALRPPRYKIIDFRYRAIETRHRKPLALHIQNQVLTHHRQTNQPYIRLHNFVSFPLI